MQAAGCNVEVTKEEAEDGEVDKLVARLLEVAMQVASTAHGPVACIRCRLLDPSRWTSWWQAAGGDHAGGALLAGVPAAGMGASSLRF